MVLTEWLTMPILQVVYEMYQRCSRPDSSELGVKCVAAAQQLLQRIVSRISAIPTEPCQDLLLRS